MGRPRKYSDDERAAALRDYEIFGPSWVEEHHGIKKQTVHTWAAEAGIHTVRNERMYAAVRAKQLDLKALRQLLIENMYIDAFKVQAKMHDPSVVYNIGGQDNSYEEHVFTEALPIDQKIRTDIVTKNVAAAVKLESVDNSSGVEDARSFVSDMAAYFGIGVKKEPDQ